MVAALFWLPRHSMNVMATKEKIVACARVSDYKRHTLCVCLPSAAISGLLFH